MTGLPPGIGETQPFELAPVAATDFSCDGSGYEELGPVTGVTGARPTPPYVSFRSFERALAEMKNKGLPHRVTRGTFPSFSPGLASQLTQAFGFLGLIDRARAPNEMLRSLVAAHGTSNWQGQLDAVLRVAFKPLFDLRLESSSREDQISGFEANYDGTAVTYRKARKFFVGAMAASQEPGGGMARDIESRPNGQLVHKHTEVPASPKVGRANGREKELSSQTRRSGRAAPTSLRSGADCSTQERIQAGYDALMNIIYDPFSMDAGSEEEQAVFRLARHLKSELAD